MGCTASVIDYDQQHEWGRTHYSEPFETRPCSKTSHTPEKSMIPSREVREDKVDDSFGEVFVDDELSKLNESERAMYDGSVDGCSKADYSINESLATKLDVSKSVATDDALYEDTSSESDVASQNSDTPDEVALYPISVDGDEDLSRGDSFIASSMAPDPILNEEENSDEITDVTRDIPGIANTNQTDICFTPRSPESNDIDMKRNVCDMKEEKLSSLFSGSLNERADIVNATRNVATSHSKLTHATTRGNPDTHERRIQIAATNSIAQKTQISFEKAKLRKEIERLRQQIQKLESRALTAEATKAFVGPCDLVNPIGDGGKEAVNTLKESSDKNSTLSSDVSLSDERFVQGRPSTFCGAASEHEQVDSCHKGFQESQEAASENEVIEESRYGFSDDLQHGQLHSRTVDSGASLDSAPMQYSVSTTEDEAIFDRSVDGSMLICSLADTQNVDDNTANLLGTSNQQTITNCFDKSDVIAAEESLTTQTVTKDNIVNSIKGVDKIPQETVQYVSDNGAHTSSENQNSESLLNVRHTALDANANKPVEFIEEEVDDEAVFVRLLNLDPWDEASELDESKIVHLINCYPYYCSVKHSFDGFHGSIYPLSAICALGASLPTIKKCYQAFPDAITKADAWVGTCLHYACSYRAPFPVVEYLAKKNPLALKAVNQFCRLPLHMACMFGADADVVAYLTRKYPGAAKKVDKLGMLPLHIACDSDIGIDSPEESVVEVLAEAYPEACLTKCEYGATPLAICVARKAPLPVLKALIKACPESLSETDRENQIPLQSALAVKASLDIITLLVDTYPSGLHTENNDNETPHDYAVRMKFDTAILNILETTMKSC